MRSLRVLLFAGLMIGLGAALDTRAEPTPAFAPLLPDDDADGQVLARPTVAWPARYRVLIIPGSGCVSLRPSAGDMARGLLHAQVLLLQKPHLLDADPLPARPFEPTCADAYLREDDLGHWLDRARRLARAALATTDASLPLILVGMSEGAELLPGLAAELPAATALVMLGNAGLDPAVTGGLQAARLGQSEAWRRLLEVTAVPRDDDLIVEGRHWRYWHVLRDWPLLAPLLDDPRPLLHAWGGRDALIPGEAFARFARVAQARPGGYCPAVFPAADHELREPGVDRLQTVWSWLEQRARSGDGWPCRLGLEDGGGPVHAVDVQAAARPARCGPRTVACRAGA